MSGFSCKKIILSVEFETNPGSNYYLIFNHAAGN